MTIEIELWMFELGGKALFETFVDASGFRTVVVRIRNASLESRQRPSAPSLGKQDTSTFVGMAPLLRK